MSDDQDKTEKQTAFPVLKDLCESRLFPSQSSLHRYTAKDISDFLFLNILALQILRSEFETLHVAAQYARATIRWGDFENQHVQATDLYVLVHQLRHGNVAALKANRSNELFLQATEFDVQWFEHWLRRIYRNQNAPVTDRRFLLNTQEGLQITSAPYRAMRRLIANWNTTATDHDKQLVMTRLLMAFRTRMPRSELLPYLEDLSKKKGLELKGSGIRNPEKDTGSTDGKSSLLAKAAMFGVGYLAGKALMRKKTEK